MSTIADNIQSIKDEIAQLKPKQSVRLLAVSKTHSASIIQCAYKAGQRDFGENYLQEALEKQALLKHNTDIVWHFIGSIQSNKTKNIANNFDWVHSVDKVKIAQRLDKQRINRVPLNICLQVNIDNESSKSGFKFNELEDVIKEIQTYPLLKLRGLMCIPSADGSDAFMKMNAIFNQYSQLDVLSMGMSGDMKQAIQYGSTMVRIGQGIFGKR